MIKLAVFDIGGVLIEFTESDYIQYLHDTKMPDVPVRDLEKFIMPLIEVMEYGTLRVPELEKMVGKHFGKNSLDMGWVRGWRKLARPKRDVLKIANDLKETCLVVLLSNVSQSRLAEMKRLIKPDGMRIFASCDLQMRKPGPHIYQYVLRELGVTPNEAVFIDNQIENVIGAEKVGMHAVWFRNAGQLKKDLKKLKVL